MEKKKKNLKTILILMVLLLAILPSFIVTSESQTWENSYGKLEVYPMIASNSFWSFKQWFNATSYLPSQNIDIAFRFNDTIKGGLYIYDGNSYNKVSFEHVSFNGYEWYIKKDVFFEQYETKHGYWEYSTNYPSGKWDLFLKRSVDSLQYALDNDLYVHLDPWFNSSYQYRKCSLVCNAIENYTIPLNITYAVGKMQADFDDLLFVSENTTTLYYWIENYSASSYCNLWLNINDTQTDETICMYYGCPGCSTPI